MTIRHGICTKSLRTRPISMRFGNEHEKTIKKTKENNLHFKIQQHEMHREVQKTIK